MNLFVINIFVLQVCYYGYSSVVKQTNDLFFFFFFCSIYKVMVDPDAPSPSNPHLKEYLHWLVSFFPLKKIWFYSLLYETLGLNLTNDKLTIIFFLNDKQYNKKIWLDQVGWVFFFLIWFVRFKHKNKRMKNSGLIGKVHISANVIFRLVCRKFSYFCVRKNS